MRKKNKKPLRRKIVLRLPDLDHSKNAVLNGLSSANSGRNYTFAMEQFITGYCSEPRLSLNRAVVLRFRLYLESLGLAAGTINQRLASVRRLAYEAADSGLLSPELTAGIRRVKGVKQLGSRIGNWLTHDQAKMLLEKADGKDLRSIRDLAMISVLLGCGLRRAELSALKVDDVQIRHGHWAIVDLVGKGGHIRTVPVPAWGKGRHRSMDVFLQGHSGPGLPCCQPPRDAVGQRDFRECHLVCCSTVRGADAIGSSCSS